MKPEEKARQQIDDQLQAAGWTVQTRDEANLGAARGVAVGEFPGAVPRDCGGFFGGEKWMWRSENRRR